MLRPQRGLVVLLAGLALCATRAAEAQQSAQQRTQQSAQSSAPPPTSAPAGSRPNFVIFLTDDQRADTLSCAGHASLKTPAIDRLASQGIRFTNAFVTTAICCVSRADYLSGCYANRHGIHRFNQPFTPEALAAIYPVLLRQAGYRVCVLGKWGIGLPPAGTFDTWNAWAGQGDFFHNHEGQRIHNSQMLAIWAAEFIRSVPSGQPFCLIIDYKSPHDPYTPDPALGDLFPGVTFPMPKTYTEAEFLAQPDFIQKSEGRKRLLKLHPTPETFQKFVHDYLSCVASVDRSVGQVLDVLKERKVADQTVTAYTSDHGLFFGEHGLTGKWLMYEESIRIPFILHDPRVAPESRGKVYDEMALSIDLAPTILELAGVQPPRPLDGQSLRSFLNGQVPPNWRQSFFYEHHFSNQGTIPRTEGIRTPRWKYITYFTKDAYDCEHPIFEQLFALDRDPLEERNLINDPSSQEMLRSLREQYRREAALHSSQYQAK